MITVKLVRIEGKSAIIIRGNDAFIVDADLLSSERAGTMVGVSKDALKYATPYGIDWNVVFPDGLCVNVSKLQEILYAKGIISIEDLKHNPTVLVEALHQLLKISATTVYLTAKEVLNDV